MTQERSLGIVGGVGPESTADYYHRLIDRWKARRPDGSYPPDPAQQPELARRARVRRSSVARRSVRTRLG